MLSLNLYLVFFSFYVWIIFNSYKLGVGKIVIKVFFLIDVYIVFLKYCYLLFLIVKVS